MNRKGFTLVELLAVLVILGVIMTIGAISVMGIWNNSNKSQLESKKNDIVGSAILYAQDNQDALVDTDCDVNGETYHYCLDLTVKDLVDSNYYTSTTLNSSNLIDVLNDVTGYSMMCDTIRVYRKNNNFYATLINVYSDSSNCCVNGSGC